MAEKFNHLFPAPKLMYEALREAGCHVKPQRNVQWVNYAADGMMALNVWRYTLDKRGNTTYSKFVRKNHVEYNPRRKRKLEALFEALQPDGFSDVDVARAALQRGVVVSPGSHWYPAEAPAPSLRLTFAAAPPAALRRGVSLLAAVMDRASR